MNITIGTKNASTWKHLKAQYIAAACGLALAASAVVATTPWHQGASTSAHLAAITASGAMMQPTPERSFVYYLAGSQQEATLFASVLSSEAAAFGSVAEGISAHVMVMDSPQAEILLGEATRELMAYGVNFRIVDLRSQ